MKEELNGLISENVGDFYQIMINDNCVADTVEDFNGEEAKLNYYISDSPINKETATENFLKSFYEGATGVESWYVNGSSWTGVYDKKDGFNISGHDITEELRENIGKYCYLIIETK